MWLYTALTYSLPIWNQSVVLCPVLTVASWPAYRFLKRQIWWSGIPISLFLKSRSHDKNLALRFKKKSIMVCLLLQDKNFSMFISLRAIKQRKYFSLLVISELYIYIYIYMYIYIYVYIYIYICNLFNRKKS